MKLKFSKCAKLAAVALSILSGGILWGESAEAQSFGAKSGRCSNYDPRPKCTEGYRNATRKKFGLPTLEKIRRRNGYAGSKSELIVTTVVFKTGGGVALVLQRDRNGAPIVEIREMVTNVRRSGPKLISVKIPEATWDMIVAKGKALDLVYATDEVLVCGAIFTVELTDGRGNIRAPVGDSCGNEPRGLFFEALAEAALAELPHCAALYPDGYDATLDRLTACFALSGQQMVAAELFNELEVDDFFWSSMGRTDPSKIRLFFEDTITFSWPGIPLIQGAETAAEFWASDWLYSVDLQYDTFHAETPDRVSVKGSVIVDKPEGEEGVKGRTGPFNSIWQRGADGKFRLQRFEHFLGH
jgi:hypothetical protein